MRMFRDPRSLRALGPKGDMRQAWILVLIFSLSSWMALKWYLLVDQYAVNLIYFDQFAFMTPYFEKRDAWAIFSWQHGPRQGLGGWLTGIVVQLSGCNTRAESFMILGVLLASLPVGLFLKRKLTGSLNHWDCLFPLIILNKYQWGQVILTPNVSPSILPLLLIWGYCLAWLIPKKFWQCVAVSVMNFLLVFTGFGLFMGPITLVLYGVEWIATMCSRGRKGEILFAAGGFGLAVFSLIFFSIGYRTCQDYCQAPYGPYMAQYPLFVSLMLSNFIGITPNSVTYPVALGVGFSILVIFIAAFIWNLRDYLRDPLNSDQKSKLTVVLIGYSLVFAVAAAMGRGCRGLGSASAFRYTTLLIPGFVGLLLTFDKLKKPLIKRGLFLIAACLLIRMLLPLDAASQRMIEHFLEKKESWKKCYLETEDYEGCNERSGFKVWKQDKTRMMPIKRLKYLKAHRWNLYQDL